MKKGLVAIILLITFHLPLFTQNVGINTTTPLSTLDVKGSLSIGTNYAGAIAAPTNGAIIEGNVGIGINSPSTLLHIAGGNILSTGTYGSSTSLEISGIGTRLFFYPRKAAFRAGYVSATNWDDANIGNYSFATGYDTKASGTASVAMGFYSEATGLRAVAIGSGSVASNAYAFALAGGTASGNGGTAIGSFTTASGTNSMSIGYNSTASASQSMAVGAFNTASAQYALALGVSSTASGDNSTTLGRGVTAASYYETALGSFNTTYTPLSTNAWNTSDRLLSIGNGTLPASRSDALTILKSGNVGIGTSTPSVKLEVSGTTKTTTLQMTNGATNGYILQSDASGNGTWVANTSAADNLGNHTATQNINLGTNYLSNGTSNYGLTLSSTGEVTVNGSTADLLNIGTGANVTSVLALKTTSLSWELGTGNGLGTAFSITDVTNDAEPFVINANSDSHLLTLNGTNVGIGTANPSVKLDVNGTTSTTNLMITNGATNGYVLQSDATGNATWINPTTLSTGTSQWTTSGSNIYKNNTANVGIGTTTPSELLHISEGNIVNSGTFNTSATLTVNGAGTRSFFYPRKGAFRAGTVTGVQFDNANIGNYSFAAGYNAQATGTYSNSLGFNNVASGSYSTAIGNGSTASGTGALSIGLTNTASGTWTTALGANTTAKSFAEVVLGQYNTSYSPSSTTTWNTSDRLFSIGNGTAAASTSDALIVLKSGNVGIGTSVPSNKLEISGTTSTTNLKLTSGATSGYVLQSDASGNGTWVAPTSLTAATQTAIKDADANTKIEVEQSSNDDKVHFTLGGKEYFTMNKGTLEFNNTGAAIYIGNAAGLTDTYTANTYNIGIGANALQKATSVADLGNTAIGIKAIQNLTTGSGNVAIGNDAMRYGNGDFNTAVGNYAGNSINSAGSGSQNVSIGNSAGAVVSGSNNTFVGTGAGANTTAGSNNVYLGLGTGENVYTGGSNVFIGYQAGASAGSTASNKLFIENSNSTSPLIYGDFTNDYVNINGKLGIGTATPSNYLDIQTTGSATASVQSSTSTAYLKLAAPSANEAGYNFSTYSSGSTSSRWLFGKSNGTESGSDVGSDFFINRYTDAGVYNGQPLSISRSTGTFTVGNAGASSTANTLKVNGSVSVPTTVQSGSFTLDGNDYCVIFTGSSGTFTLPTASTCSGRIYLMVNQGTVVLTTSTYRTGSATTVTSIAIGASVQVISDGTEWRKIN